MKPTVIVTGPARSKVKLTFGVYGLKNFCKRLGCEPNILSVLSAFQGGTRLEAMSEIIRSGMEQQSVDAGKTVPIADYEACEILETTTEAEAESAMKAFFSSIVNEDYDTWLARLKETTDKAEAEAEAAENGEPEKKNGKPQTGTKLKKKRTAKLG